MENGAFAELSSQRACIFEFPVSIFQFPFSSFRFPLYCASAILCSHFWKSAGSITFKKARIL
jgi:hypothetical protein